MNMKSYPLLPPTLIRKRRIQLLTLPSQERFLRCQAPKKGFSGPVGSGKTVALGYQTNRQETHPPLGRIRNGCARSCRSEMSVSSNRHPCG